MTLFALSLVLLQAAAATPVPSAEPTPTPTPRPAYAGPRTLQDVARERRLSAGAKTKGTLGTISVGPSTASGAPKSSAGAAATTTDAPAAPEATPDADAAAATPSVRVTTVANDGMVDAVGGVRVNGTVRNAGGKSACNVVIAVKILDDHGNYLASSQAAPDVAIIAPGEVVSFHTIVQAPPGVRGARTSSDRRDVVEGSTTMAGDWKLLGGSDASVSSASEDCGK